MSAAGDDGYDVLDSAEAGGRAMRGGVVRTAAYTGSLLLSLLSAPLLIHHLGDDFGRYASVLAIIAIVTGLTEGGLGTLVMQDLAAERDEDGRRRLLADLLGLRLVLSALGIGGAVGFAALAGYGGDLVLGTFLAGIGMVFAVSQVLLGNVLQARLRFAAAALIELTRGALTAAAIVVLVLAGSGVLGFLALTVPTSALAFLAAAVVTRDVAGVRPALAPRRWGRLLRRTAVFAVSVAVNSLYFRLTLVVMSLVATEADTTAFAVSFRVLEVLVGVPGLIVGAAFPILSRAARDDRGRFESATARLFELSLIAGVATSLALTLSAPFVVEVLTGSAHDAATNVLRIQSLAMIASFVASATGFALLGLHRLRESLWSNLASLVVVTVLALALAPAAGAQGGAVAAVAADMALAVSNTLLLRRRGGPPLPLGIVVVGLTAGAVGYAAARATGLHPLLQAAVGLAILLGLLRACGRFPPEVAELLRGLRQTGARKTAV